MRVIKFKTGFNIPYTEDHKLLSNAIVLDIESICVPTEELKATETTNWIEKQVPISISMSSNLQDDPFFLSEKELLIIPFVSSSELLAEKRKFQLRTNFQEIENFVNDRVKKFFDKHNARTLTERLEILDYEDECAEHEEEYDTSTQFLRIQKNQLIDLKQHLDRYVNTLPLFGFNSGRCDLNLIKSFLIPYLKRDKEIDPTVLKKVSDFISLVYVGADQGGGC